MSFPSLDGRDEQDAAPMFNVLLPNRKIADAYIAPSFLKKVLVHLVRNQLPNTESAIFLGIQGAPGEGKSFQARAVCSRYGVRLLTLSGAQLGGRLEGQASEVIAQAYLAASKLEEDRSSYVAILIDDFDLCVASNVSGRQYTVNSQLLNGFLMNLADDPTTCRGEKTRRIPILLTANDLTSVHRPLMRHGRMELLSWQPDAEERSQIVRSILEPLVILKDRYLIRSLFDDYAEMPISFFSSLKSDLIDETILDNISRANKVHLSAIREACQQALTHLAIDALQRVAHARANRRVVDYLKESTDAG